MNLHRLFRTVRHLRPVQVYGRAGFLLARPRVRLGAAPSVRVRTGEWTAPVERVPALLGPDRIRLLNEEGPIAWDDPGRERLWTYNVHYFDELGAGGGGERDTWRRGLVGRWIAENPPGAGPGWEPYPVSLRVVNWIKWMLGGAEGAPGWLESLAAQASWLEGRLEHHLLGNHLWANAKALVFAGLWFQGAEAERWLRRGLGILERELAEQILADGGHFERSPMYHAILLEDLLDLINLAVAYGRDDAQARSWWGTALAMRRWLKVMSHPDGQIALFNDAAFEIAPTSAELEAYAGRLGLDETAPFDPALEVLGASGYVRAGAGDAVLICDCAPVGPDYLPGHAHADTLSFELSLGPERVVVNGGTSTYGTGSQRQIERATASHSTVEIDGQNSSEVWAGFRVGRRARVLEAQTGRAEGAVTIGARHDGYRWRPGRPMHARSWRLEPGRLTISDRIAGRAGEALARLHLHPDVAASGDGRAGEFKTAGGRTMEWRTDRPSRLQPSQWRPRFGVRIPSLQLASPLQDGRLQTELSW